ncbi:MAG TPA: hypothetical protein VF665_03740 [Longimicrobium sp.]|jgi:hypothetical protein|uniref:hypothetical protein n=1 Tax=Longimicrobium sp. TaxID=2029185 RepID=UPI002EDB2890
MIRTDRFSLEKHAGPYESWPLRTRLFADGEPTDVRIPAYVMLHQFQVDDGYLLIGDQDCPFEEATVFALLSHDLRLLSCRVVGHAYNTFLLTGLEWVNPRQLIASFGDDLRMRVTIRPRGIPVILPRLRLDRIRDR